MLDREVSPVDVTGAGQPMRKGLDKRRIAGSCSEGPNPRRPCRRLRLGGERSGEEAECANDERPSLHYSIT